MKHVFHRPLTAVLAVAGLAAGTAGCGGSSGVEAAGETRASADSSSPPARVVDVRTRTVRPGIFVDRLQVTGTVEAERTVRLEAEESGRIRAVHAEKGERLPSGAPILQIDDRELRARLEEARARAELAREQWERRRQLYEEENAISELAYLRARSEAEQAAARVKRLESRLADTSLEAPFAGVLDERPVEVGSNVSPGTHVATLVDLRPAKVSAGVPERYASDVAVGDSATVTVPSLDDEEFSGTLTYVGAAVNEDSRTLPVEVELPNTEGRLKPAMVANVALVRKRWRDAIVAPQDAVLRTSDGFAVYVVEQGEGGPVARRRPVELGPREDDRVLVESGLETGDRLVTVGQQQLADGDRVRLAGSPAATDEDDADAAGGEAP